MIAVEYRQASTILERGERAVLMTTLRGNGGAIERACVAERDLKPGNGTNGDEPEIAELCRQALKAGVLAWRELPGGDRILAMPCFPSPRLIVLGAGHIALPLAEFGSKLGFKVTVCDDRASFADPARFPAADRVICAYWDKCLELAALDPSCYVVIITRGHRHDVECFRRAASRDLPYVGMIGSRRRISGVKAHLLAEGIPREALDRLHAPIGLDIGAVTPEEIALSIIAQVVFTRRKEAGERGDACGDPALLAELCAERDERRALVTIVGSAGSAPRGAGAQMLVWPEGKTLGSIGGGCSEGDAILAALDVIREGGFKLLHIDLSGSLAEDEGMVCGGMIDVLVEAV
jgi:xanthine dehydrogenase accessory factor